MIAATDPSVAVVSFVQSILSSVTPATVEFSAHHLIQTLDALGKLQPDTASVLTRIAISTAVGAYLTVPNEGRGQLVKRLIVHACSHIRCTYFLSDMLGDTPFNAASLRTLLRNLHMDGDQGKTIAILVALCYSTADTSRSAAKELLIECVGRHADQVKEINWANPSSPYELLYLAENDSALRKTVVTLRRDFLPPPSTPEQGVTTLAAAATALGESISITGLVSELGSVLLSTKEGCLELLSLLPAVRPSTIAATLAALTIASTESTSAQLLEYAAMRSAMQWTDTANVDDSPAVVRLAQCVKETYPDLDWSAVIRALDAPDIVVGSFPPIVAAYKRVRGHELPADLLMGKWVNARLQATALRFAFNNPALVARPKAGRHLSRELAPPERRNEVEWWTSIAFVEAVVGVCAVDRDMECLINTAAARAPALLFTALGVAQPQGTAANLTMALGILRQYGVDIVTEPVVNSFQQASRFRCLILLLSELALHEPAKLIDVVEVVVKHHLVAAILKESPTPVFAVAVAIAGRESKQVPDSWLEQALDPPTQPRGTTPVRLATPYAFASALVEVCDEFNAKQKFMPAISFALRSFLKSPIAAKAPLLRDHAQTLVGALPDAFSEDVEREAEAVFRAFLFDPQATPILTLDALHASTKLRDRQIFACMVNLMLEESACVESYSWSALEVIARLVGHVINDNMLSSNQLQTALRIVLHSLQSKPSDRVFEFGVKALEIFKYRLPEWPQYGRQLRQVDLLDMRIPGICAIINGAAHTLTSTTPVSEATVRAAPTSAAALGYHQLDIRTLVSEQVIAPPTPAIQDQLNFLVGNTDPSNVEANANELVKILTLDFYPYFADYFVVKRVALEPNHHRMYLRLLELIALPKLDNLIRTATVAAAKRMLKSDKIRLDAGDRSLLKSLGSWYGQLTVARNIPPLASEIDFGKLLYHGLKDGKLIAVVPFMAKVLEWVSHSRVFKPPNPWTMRQLEYLYDVYCLRDLKMTLCFEIDLLFKNIDVKIDDVLQFSKSHPYMFNPLPSMASTRASMDVTNSCDFRPEDPSGTAVLPPRNIPQASSETPPKPQRSAQLRRDAVPFQPKAAELHHPPAAGAAPQQPPQVQTVVLPPAPTTSAAPAAPAPTSTPAAASTAAVPVTPPFAPSLPMQITENLITITEDAKLLQDNIDQYRSALQKVFDAVLKECHPTALRIAEIAAVATKEIVTKDFSRDTDMAAMNLAARHMVRSLASNLCTTNKEMVTVTFVRFVRAIANRVAKENAAEEENLVKRIQTNNLQLVFRVFEAQTSAAATDKVERMLNYYINERRDKAETFPEIVRVVPEPLRPPNGGAIIASKIYSEFQLLTPLIELLNINLRTIEDLSAKHCQSSATATPLSLSNEDFYAKAHSQPHMDIRERMGELNKLIAPETVSTITHVIFKRLMSHSDKYNNSNDPTQRFMGEIFLWLLKRVRELHPPAVKEITQLYLHHERAWKHSWLAAHLFKIQVIDVADFDTALARELHTRHSQGDRSIVEFAGSLIHSSVLSDRLTTTRDVQQTIRVLEEIAKRDRAKTPSFASHAAAAVTTSSVSPAPSYPEDVHTIRMWTTNPATPERVAYAKETLVEYAAIVHLKVEALGNEGKMDAWKQQQRRFLDKLNARGVLKADTGDLDSFLSALVEVAVGDFATNLLALERAHPPPASMTHTLVNPPPSRYSSTHDLFRRMDTFCEVVYMLSRCATRVDHPFAAEIHLLSRVLKCVNAAAANNHDAFMPSDSTRPRPPLPEGHAYQNEFQQQPYVRFFSMLMLVMRPPEGNPSADAVGKLFAEALHILAPYRYPAFAFGWLELVCHRSFTSRVFRCRDLWHPYVKLIADALRFIDQNTRRDRVAPAMLLFTKSFLKLMLVILHDFPDLLITYHQMLCDAIPPHCVQLRNIVLCAFPSKVRLPDPFQRWIDGPVELSGSVPLAVDVARDRFDPPLRMEEIFRDAPNSKVTERLRLSPSTSHAGGPSTKWSIPAINALVLESAMYHLKSVLPDPPVGSVVIEVSADMPLVKLYVELASTLDNEGRYYFVNALVNQLRWPSPQTMLFARLVALFFSPTNGGAPHWPSPIVGEQLQEQIARALVERLIICRPHPWGLLVTFVALIVNTKYQFWERPFVSCSTDVEAALRQLADTVRSTNERNQTVPSSSS